MPSLKRKNPILRTRLPTLPPAARSRVALGLTAAAALGRFELQQASISGVPVPKTLLQELVSYYSKTADDPRGIDIDEPFALPAGIRQIEVKQGQAVVVQ